MHSVMAAAPLEMFVGVGRPEVEGHQRDLEAQATEEEYHTHDGQCRRLEGRSTTGRLNNLTIHKSSERSCDIVEVERAGCSIDERDAIEHYAAGERGHQNILRSSLSRVLLPLVEGHQTGQGH